VQHERSFTTPKSPDLVDKHIGRRIRALRTILGMSQEKLAEALGITFQQVQKYENGTNRVSAGRLHHVASVLGVPVGRFYEEAPERERELAAARAGDSDGISDLFGQVLGTTEGLRLVKSFAGIEDVAVRRRVAELCETLAESLGPQR
jgi:transcriptional regulator with XRE-family HTH domain